jgi:VanZ family protein
VSKIILSYIYVALWIIIITYLSSTTPSVKPSLAIFKIPHFDKFVHFSMYFIFSLFLSLLYFRKKQNINNKLTFQIVCIASIYGIIMEIFQHIFWEGRSGDVADVAANILGAYLGVLFFLFISKFSIIKKVL